VAQPGPTVGLDVGLADGRGVAVGDGVLGDGVTVGRDVGVEPGEADGVAVTDGAAVG
jgi:hypothetical protein